MAQRSRQRRRGPSLFWYGAMASVLLLIVGGVGYGAAVATDLVPPPSFDIASWFRSESEERLVQPPGTVAVYFALTDIPAYTRINRDHIVNPSTLQPTVQFFPPDQVPERWIQNPAKLIGRVLADDKTAGRVFTDNDLLPAGTAAGIAGGVPPGHRAVVIPSDDVAGLSELKRFDHFDVFVSGDFPQVLIEDGIVIQPAYRMLTPDEERRRQASIEANRGRPVDEKMDVVIAVRPEFVDVMSHALARASSTRRRSSRTSGTQLVAVVRSGHPEAGDEEPLAGRSNVVQVETMRGHKRDMMSFMRRGQGIPSAKGTTVVRTP